MMSSVTELYSSLYEKLWHLQECYQKAQSQMSIAAEQDEATRAVRIENLEEQLRKIEEYADKLEYFRHLAEKHLESKNLLTIEPRELNFNRLRNWAMQIDPTETDDPYAQRIYVLVKSNEHFLRIKKEEFEKTLAALRSQENNSGETEKRALRELRIRLLSDMVNVLESEEFARFAELLMQRHQASSNIVSNLTAENMQSEPVIGIGGYAKALPVFDELRYMVKEKLGDYYDAKNASVLLPVEHSLDSDMFFVIGCAASKAKKLYRGLQNYLLNQLSRTPIGSRRVCLLDALHFNNSTLGYLRPLEDSTIFWSIPKDAEQIQDTLKQIVSEFPDIDETLGLADSVAEYNQTAEPHAQLTRTILILVGYPSAFSSESRELIRRILFNYEHYGITPILIDDQYVPKDENSMPNVPVDIAEGIYRIRMTQSKELISKNNGVNHHFRWYELRNELDPKFIERVRSMSGGISVLGTEYTKRVDLENVPAYERGKKSIVLPYGVDSKDVVHSISFDNENFASYLMGASGSGKSTLLHTLITGIIRDYHPDDVELWLADFKMSEFAQYINPLPPHVKYILLDESHELVYDLLDKLTEKMMERQRFFMKHRDMKKVENVPKDIYMPVIFVLLDEFSIMSQAVNASQEYRIKLQNLLAKGRALGIKFLFSSQTFTTGIGGLTATAKAQIQSRIAMKNSKEEISATLELSASQKTDQVRNWVEALPPHYALYKYREADTIHIKRLQVMYFKGKGEAAYEPQRNLINSICQRMKPVAKSAYDANYPDRYVDKKPVIVDGNSFEAFDPVSLLQHFHRYRSTPDNHVTSEDKLLAFGTPRRMSSAKFSTLTAEARENLLLVARSAEQSCGMAVILSATESFMLQGGRVHIWAYRRNRLYRTYLNSHLHRYDVVEGIDAICDEIRSLKEKIRTKQSGNDLIVMIGMERICADFEYVDASAVSKCTKPVKSFEERQKEREAELIRSGAVVTTDAEEIKRQQALLWLKLKSEVRSKAKAEGKSKAEIEALLEAAKKEFFAQAALQPDPQPAAEPVPEKQPERPAQQEPPAEEVPPTGTYNAKEDFKYIVKQGSKLGYHFMLCLSSLADLTQTGLKADVFRYRMAFQVSEDDSRILFGNKHANELPEHICQYVDAIERYSFRPYLHRGLTWEGWYVSDDEYKALNAFDI